MTHTPLPAFKATSGPRSAKLLLVGEAWGESEDQIKRPFVGESGKELFRMLGEAMPLEFPDLHAQAEKMTRYGLAWVKDRETWLEACGIAMTNVLALRPPGNKMESLCLAKKDLPDDYPDFPAIIKGQYLAPQYLPELDRLRTEIESINPNLIVCLGNTACWALLCATNIGSIRGAVAGSSPRAFRTKRTVRTSGVVEEEGAGTVLEESPVGGSLCEGETRDEAEDKFTPGLHSRKIIATYHPAGVMRNWAWRPIVVADLMKAWREAQFPEIRRPERQVQVSLTLPEVETFVAKVLAKPPPFLSVDIETGFGQIKCIGFARSCSEAFVISFMDEARPGWHYWANPGEELAAWEATRALLESPIPKLGQNFLYDLQYILKTGIRPRNCLEDTMLLHHSHFPEMQKGLGFLGSIYTNENSWKLMNRVKHDSEKRDE